jgi:SAM-dependent methyltransferase
VSVVDAESLTRNNLAYREPALYDELLADDTLTADLTAVLARHHPKARTILDLGCGTARLLAELHRRDLNCTGVDLQPDLIRWAQHTHRGMRLDIGDLCAVRLGTTFDVVTCVGNTLSYLHTDAELTTAFDTIRAHSHSGTMLAVATLIGTGRDTRSTSEITSSLGAATVTTTTAWDPTTAIQTTTRTWRFATGRVEHDTLRRRFWSHNALVELAHGRGFEVVAVSPTSLTLCAVRRR